MAAVLALAGTGMAGAFGGIMDTEVGYGYNSAADGIHSAHIEVKPIPKLAVGAEYRHWNNRGNETDVYAKYKVGHFYVGAGNRNYYDRDARMYGLIEGKPMCWALWMPMQAFSYPAKKGSTRRGLRWIWCPRPLILT